MNPIASTEDMDEFVSARGSLVMLRDVQDQSDSTGLIETMQSDVDVEENNKMTETTKKLEQGNNFFEKVFTQINGKQ